LRAARHHRRIDVATSDRTATIACLAEAAHKRRMAS
jgi:hypothetical protein